MKASIIQKPKYTIPSMLMEEKTHLEHCCRLDFTTPATHRRMSGIVCSISKSSQSPETVLKMLQAGMNIVRLNFSHDSQDFHAQTINIVREATLKYSEEMGYAVPVAIALDTKGPEIRTGAMENNKEVELKSLDTIRLSTNKEYLDKGTRDVVYIDYPNITNEIIPGTHIFLNDGAIRLVCKDVTEDTLFCFIEKGGLLGSRKSVSIPDVEIDLPTVSEKDRFDLKFAVIHSVDFVFAAAIRSAAAISEIRGLLGEKGKDIKVIAKIENIKGLENMDEIIAAADGIMILRANIGVHVPMHKLFLAQKAIIARCNRVGKPVVCGTQILESMVKVPYPTRSEVADIGNAIIDGADCIMLSSETGIGAHPFECVEVLDEVIRESETALWYQNLFEDLVSRNAPSIDAPHAVAIETVYTAKKSLATAIIVLTTSGRSSHLLAKYRPRCPILALTRCPRTARQCNIHRGVVPILYTETINDDWLEDVESRIQYAMTIGKKMGIIQSGDTIVVLSPWKDGGGFTNNMRIVYAFFENEWIDCLIRTDKKKDEKERIERTPNKQSENVGK